LGIAGSNGGGACGSTEKRAGSRIMSKKTGS
jgi:hypothetical protein